MQHNLSLAVCLIVVGSGMLYVRTRFPHQRSVARNFVMVWAICIALAGLVAAPHLNPAHGQDWKLGVFGVAVFVAAAVALVAGNVRSKQ